MLLFDRKTHPAVIAVIVAVMGIGIGFTFQPTLVAFQAHCTKKQRAVVISDRNFFRCLGGACNLAISAALLQATLKSNLPPGYEYLSDSTYSLPSKSSVPTAEWSRILDAYAKASRSVFILQVPLIGVCFIACLLIRDRGLEPPSGPGDEENGGMEKNKTEASASLRNQPGTETEVNAQGGNQELHSVDPARSTSANAPGDKTLREQNNRL